jgi:hypothetical protein
VKRTTRSRPIKIDITNVYAGGCYVSVRHIRERRDLDNVYVAATDWQEGVAVSPQCYWQLNANEDGAAYFAIDSETDDQTILGLPFMNGFFCVFDRSADRGLGVVRLAQAKPPR